MFPTPMMELLRLKPSVCAEGFIVGDYLEQNDFNSLEFEGINCVKFDTVGCYRYNKKVFISMKVI